MDSHNRNLDIITKILISIAVVGALNWGLIGFFNFNLVDAIFGGGSHETTSDLSRVIYAIVGVAGLVGAALMPQLHATGSMRVDRPARGMV